MSLKISQMTVAASVAGADVVPIVQGGVNKQAAVQDLLAEANIPSLPESRITNLTTDLGNKAIAARLFNTTAPITGGGDLSADRTLAIAKATTIVDGYLAATDFTTFNNKVSATRAVNATAPITGGGDLSADRTLAIAKSTAGVDGYLAAADFTVFNAKVGTSRAINTTAPVTGGGDLSADRTIAMAKSTAGVDGYLAAADFTTFNAKVATSRAINTTAPITGGGDLSADRTIALSTFVASGASHAAGGVPDPGATAGTLNYLREDATFALPAQAYNVNVTPVTVNANSTNAQNLMSFTLTGGNLNVLNRTLEIFSAGAVTINNTGTVTFIVKLGSITLLTWASATLTAAITNLPWSFQCSLTCQATGATGKLESHGNCNVKASAGAGATVVYADGNTGVSGSIDLTSNQTLQVTVTFGANSASPSTCVQRQMVTKLL